VIVCHCARASDRVVHERIAGGARSVEDLGADAGIGAGCGGCRPALEHLLARTHQRLGQPVAS